MKVPALIIKRVCIFSGMLLMALTNANATVVNIDFGPSSSTTYSGEGILGGGAWNSVDIGGATNLAFADGSGSSGIGIDTGGFVNSFSNLGNGTFPASNNLLADRIINFPASDYDPASFTVTGLTAGALYNVVLYNGFYAQDYSIGGDSATTDPNFLAPSSGDSAFGDWTAGVEYVRFNSVVADGSGNLVITVAPWDGDNDITGVSGAGEIGYATVAGMQIQAVPIPAAVYLFGTGLLALAGIARRKKTV